MASSAANSLLGDPMLLPPREAPYCLRSAFERVIDECRQELVLDWGDCHLLVRVDADTDTLDTIFHDLPFVPTELHRNLEASAPWDRLLGKECDWTWVAVNQQGYRDLILLSFDVMFPQVILHALASSIEVIAVSSEREQPTVNNKGVQEQGVLVKKLIALRGAANRGKTQTIRKVYDLLLAEYPNAQQLYPINQTDLRVILAIAGMKIGIESKGDPNSRLKESLKSFVQQGCQVIICATRTSGMSVAWVNDLQDKYNLVWLDQVTEQNPSEQESRNQQTATQIVAEVKEMIVRDNSLKGISA